MKEAFDWAGILANLFIGGLQNKLNISSDAVICY